MLIITGASKGIGLEIARAFAAEGMKIILNARNPEGLAKAAAYLHTQGGAEVHTFAADLSERKNVEAFAEFALKHGTPEVLVNNAGVFYPGQVHLEEEGAFEQMMHTNLFSAYHLTRAILPKMMENKAGHVFNICSTASIMPYVNGGSYCISKFALYGMSQVLREEMKPHGIRVTAVLPGATRTASWDGTDLPEERFMPAEDVAAAVHNAWKMSDRTVIEELRLRPQLGDI